MQFSEPELLAQLVAADAAAIEDAAFGIIGMNLDGVVTRYNRHESAISGLSPDRVVGKHFFSAVAPCTNNFMVAQRYEDSEELDETIDYVFTLRMRPTKVRLRLLKSAKAGRQFLAVERV
ncbi:MAG: PAS domain-containing protein [Alphaproteobacteria bacterium]|nr:PAS domain-containing protein [Alphaproteobacteria bacterium]